MENHQKKAIIVINAYTESTTELNQPNRLKYELELLGVQTQILRNFCLSSQYREGQADFCVYLDKDKYCAKQLQQKVRLFNRAEAIEVCDDKMLTHLALDGLPMPETIAGTLCYTPNVNVAEEIINQAESQLGYPVVVKECYGSLGKGVYLAKDRSELVSICENVKGKPHLFQEFIQNSYGTDVRVIVVGGEVVACMQRVSNGDFRSNAELGGKGVAYELSEEGKRLCEEISVRLGLDYCGIDLLFGKNGFLVCEVNSNAFFGTIEKISNVNVAKTYAKYLYRTVYKNEIMNETP